MSRMSQAELLRQAVLGRLSSEVTWTVSETEEDRGERQREVSKDDRLWKSPVECEECGVRQVGSEIMIIYSLT